MLNNNGIETFLLSLSMESKLLLQEDLSAAFEGISMRKCSAAKVSRTFGLCFFFELRKI